ncbi:MAG: hypothetical protein ACPG8W_22760 [Candidatus Promineifilaceae bacterium]
MLKQQQGLNYERRKSDAGQVALWLLADVKVIGLDNMPTVSEEP